MARWLCHVMPYALQDCALVYPSLPLHHRFPVLSVLFLLLFKSVSSVQHTCTRPSVFWMVWFRCVVGSWERAIMWTVCSAVLYHSLLRAVSHLHFFLLHSSTNFSHFQQYFKVWWRETTLETKRLLCVRPSFHVCAVRLSALLTFLKRQRLLNQASEAKWDILCVYYVTVLVYRCIAQSKILGLTFRWKT